jgi:hypothetical protein
MAFSDIKPPHPAAAAMSWAGLGIGVYFGGPKWYGRVGWGLLGSIVGGAVGAAIFPSKDDKKEG